MRLTCWLYERRLSALALSGEKPMPDSPLARHIALCPHCQQASQEFAGLTGQLGNLTAPAMHLDIERGVLSKTIKTPTPRSTAWRPSTAIALTIVVPLGVWAYTYRAKQVTERQQPVAGAIAPVAPPAPQATHPPRLRSMPFPAPQVARSTPIDSTPAPTLSNPAPRAAHQQVAQREATPEQVRVSGKPARPSDVSTPVQTDQAFLNGDGFEGYAQRMSALLKQDAKPFLSTVRGATTGDDFVSIPAPQVATNAPAAMAEALNRYEQEKSVVDARLQHKLTIGKKRISFADLCEQISKETGIELTATRSVGDEKLTLFCKDRPLREIMRQVTRLFGFTWERSGDEDRWRYKLTEPLKVRILEEELRNKDRNDALLALDRDMEAYKDLLGLTPEDARAQADGAIDAKKKERLKLLGGTGWGPAQLYSGLSSDERDALLAGKSLSFRGEGDSAQGALPLPTSLRDSVLKSLRGHAFIDGDSTSLTNDRESEFAKNAKGISPDQVPGVVPSVGLSLRRSELGQFELLGFTGFSTGSSSSSTGSVLATGISPSAASPENAKVNAALGADPRYKATTTMPTWQEKRKVTTADLLEAVHKATGKDVIGDYFTRLYEAPTVWNKTPTPLFDILNKACDATRLRWEDKEGFLAFRSTDFFNMRLKEVPNRLMDRWAQARQEKKQLSPEELREMSRLTDFQLDSSGMAEGAQVLWGIDEWDDVRSENMRPVWRFLDSLPTPQRTMMLGESGLHFAGLGLDAQRGFISLLYFPGETIRESMENGTATAETLQRLGKATVMLTDDPKRLSGARVGQGNQREWFLVVNAPTNNNSTMHKVVGRESMASNTTQD